MKLYTILISIILLASVCCADNYTNFHRTQEWREVKDSIILIETQNDFLKNHVLAIITPRSPQQVDHWRVDPVTHKVLRPTPEQMAEMMNPPDKGTISIIKDISNKPTTVNTTYSVFSPDVDMGHSALFRDGEGKGAVRGSSPYPWNGTERSTVALLICPPETISGNFDYFPRTWVPIPSFLQLALTFNPSARVFDAKSILNQAHPTDEDIYWLLIELNADPSLFKGPFQPEFLNYYKHLSGLVRSIYIGAMIDLLPKEDWSRWITSVTNDDLSGVGPLENQYYDLLGIVASKPATTPNASSPVDLYLPWMNPLKGQMDPRAKDIIESYKPLLDAHLSK